MFKNSRKSLPFPISVLLIQVVQRGAANAEPRGDFRDVPVVPGQNHTDRHPFLGAKLLEGVPGMEETRRVILEHQEFFDGSGYPSGLQGEEISLGARILSLAEFYDSITSSRPHRGGLRHEEALQLMRNNMNTIFEPRICKAFLEEIREPLLPS